MTVNCTGIRCYESAHYHVMEATGNIVHYGDEWQDGWTNEDWVKHTRAKYPELWEPVPKGRLFRQREKAAEHWREVMVNREWKNHSSAGKAGY